jgi:hypothetical protein
VDLTWIASLVVLAAASSAHPTGPVRIGTALDTLTVWSMALLPYSLAQIGLGGEQSRYPDPPDQSLPFTITSGSRVGVLITPASSPPESWHDVAERYATAIQHPGSREPRWIVDSVDVAFEFPPNWYPHAHLRFADSLKGRGLIQWIAYGNLPVSEGRSLFATPRRWPDCPPADSLRRSGRWVGSAAIDLTTGRVLWIRER